MTTQAIEFCSMACVVVYVVNLYLSKIVMMKLVYIDTGYAFSKSSCSKLSIKALLFFVLNAFSTLFPFQFVNISNSLRNYRVNLK